MPRPKKRYLKGNAGTEGPTSLLFFDSENWTGTTRADPSRTDGPLRLWVAAYVRRDGPTWRKPVYHRGTTSAEFWDLVERLSSWSRPLWAFAHNLGHDLTKLLFWDELEKWRWTAGPVEREPDPDTGKPRKPWRGRLALEGRPTFLVLRGSRGVLKLVDTGNYWPSKLDRIGEHFGIPKLPKPDFNGPEAPLWEYCTRDVDVCRVAVCELLKFWIRENCGTFQLTGPSLAMTNYRHCGPKVDNTSDRVPIVLEDDSPARKLERRGFIGPRIEPFFLGTTSRPIYELDCNGLYPFVMANNLFPRKRCQELTGCSAAALERKLAAYGAIADVRIDTGTSSDTYPVRRDGVLCCACGTFATTLAGPELLRALRAGHVVSVGEAYLYSMMDLFGDWSRLWTERKIEAQRAGDLGQAEFCKLLLVSLPGKFAQKGDYWADDGSRVLGRKWGRLWRKNVSEGTYEEWRAVAGHVQKRTPGAEPGNAFPAITAYVTSLAREYMRAVFARMPERTLLYSATDSIICTYAGFERLEALGLIHPDEPGKFRHSDTYGSASIMGPNYYRLDENFKCSGLYGKARPDGKGGLVADLWDRLPTLIQSNPKGRGGFVTVPVEEVCPTIKNGDAGDGWRRPFRFSDDPDFTDRPTRSRSRLVPVE